MSNKVRKNLMLIAIISFCILVLGGTSYALLRSEKTSANNYVINVGDVEVTFQGATNSLNVDKMYPMTDDEGSDQEKELVFTVKNTGSVKAYFNVSMEETSTNPEFKSVLKYIVKKDPGEYNQPVILSENKYIDYNASLDPDGEYTYHVKVYLAEEAGNTYMSQTFTAKIHIEASQEPYEEKVEAKTAVDVLKEKLGTDGLVGVKEDNTMTTAKEDEVREYRYSGLGVKNYVRFNNELWRILGIFKDEAGQEHMKIVRDEVLKRDVFPATYTANGETFNIQYTSSGDDAYWDNPTLGSYYYNWGEAGLMYWLNSKGTTDGYLKTLTSEAQGMIEETKWYLGTLTFDGTNRNIKDTVAEAYNYERAVTGCTENKGPSGNKGTLLTFDSTPNCRVFADNAAYWEGEIGLMYPSDYGYTVDSQYWTNTMISSKGFTSTVVETSWLQKEANHSVGEWFLSPSSNNSSGVAFWNATGYVNVNNANYIGSVRPSLNLKSDINVTSGTGEKSTPYELSGN